MIQNRLSGIGFCPPAETRQPQQRRQGRQHCPNLDYLKIDYPITDFLKVVRAVMSYTPDEMMTVAAARALRDRMTCFVGIGLPSEAANLARATHAPHLVLIYESVTIGAQPGALPLSIGDGILAQTADSLVTVPEIFHYWLQPGRIDVGF